MMIEGNLFKRAMRACAYIATSEIAETKNPELHRVIVLETTAKGVSVLSTDGHRALRASIECKTEVSKNIRAASLMEIESFEQITDALKATQANLPVFVTDLNGSVEIDLSANEAEHLTLKLPTVTRPKFPEDALFAKFDSLPKRKDFKGLAIHDWEFSVDYLADFLAVVEKFDGEGFPRMWAHWPTEVGEPIGFSTARGVWRLDYLLMPCRQDPE